MENTTNSGAYNALYLGHLGFNSFVISLLTNHPINVCFLAIYYVSDEDPDFVVIKAPDISV